MSLCSCWRVAIAGLALFMVMAPSSPAQGDEPDNPINPGDTVPNADADDTDDTAALRQEIEALQERLESLEQKVDPSSSSPSPSSSVEFRPHWSREELGPAPLRDEFDKPFLLSLWRRAHIGGYTELEYHSFEDGPLGIPRGFRAHRTNLFAFAEVSDTVRFASEIEFEYEEPGEDLEINVEMAFLDWTLAEEFVVRGGTFLAPLGRINVNHDGPAREFTDRPMVSRFVIPTTISEAGVGAHGSLALSEEYAFQYEAYLTNGFQVLDRDGELAAPIGEIEQILREGRPSLGGDFNKSLSSTGRLGFNSEGIFDLGASWHIGHYDERQDNLLTILAADAAIVLGDLSFEGEFAHASFERDDFARSAGVPDRYFGYYAQAAFDLMPQTLKESAPSIFDRDGTRFTLALRYDYVDLDGDRGEALEPGLNFRPSTDTVFKLSYRFGFNSVGARDVQGREDFDDDGFVFSVSTYF